MTNSKIKTFAKTRIATIDIGALGLKKHHIAAILEIDVTKGRERIAQHNKSNNSISISFTAWLIKVISVTIKEYEDVASYLGGKQKLVVFEDINVSIIIEKELHDKKIPIPLIIEKANDRSITSITNQIKEARTRELSNSDILLHRKANKLERFYYLLPGSIRRLFWRYLLRHPEYAYKKMGNVAFTSVGMLGKANAWFIPISIHPICFGVGNVLKKPVVIDDTIQIREILNVTVLLDHDVGDGGLMARFISSLTNNLENSKEL